MKSSQQLVLALASNLALLATVSAAPASVHAKTIDWQWCAPEDKDNPELCPTAVSFPPEVPNDIGDITVPVPDPIFTPPPGPIEWPTPEPTPGQEPEPVTVITILKPTPGKEDALLTLLRDGWAKGASDSGGLLADEARPAKDLDGKDKGWVWREVYVLLFSVLVPLCAGVSETFRQ